MKEIFFNYNERVAIIDDKGVSLSYSQMFEAANKLFKFINKRCLVFNLCNNSIGSLIGYVSSQINHYVPLMLNEKIDETLFQNLLKAYQPEYIWCPQEKDLPFKCIYKAYGYCLYATDYAGFDLHDELALLLTTSGSTGSPKLVRQSYLNILSNTKSIVEYLAIDANEKPITTLPMNYTYGLSIINTHLHVGATILLTDKNLLDKDFWDFFKKENATSFGGVPYTYEMLYRLKFFNMDLPSLKTMTQAGGKLLPELHKKFAEYAQSSNKNFVVMYGQTEATARMGYLPTDKSLEKYGSMGIAIPGGKFDLLDSQNQIITESDVVGELVYSGDNVTMGYALCGQDLIKGDERHGFLQTGDMAKRDEDGYYYIVGRLKRFLKIFGNRINLDETERLIKSHFSTIECACGGHDDLMKIYVVSNDKSTIKEIRKFISEKTHLNLTAFKIVIVKEIPKNDSGKVLYKELEKY